MRECQHDLRGISMFKKQLVRTNVKYHCITVKGVNLWNNCSEELKTYKTVSLNKRLKIAYLTMKWMIRKKDWHRRTGFRICKLLLIFIVLFVLS